MGIEQRPYIGTWKLNSMKLVQHTPDCLVYINGDTSIPGCHRCNGRIDLQQFITQVSVEAATNPGGASAQISLALPRHYKDSFVRDGQFLMHPGMEVHVYQKGYFPVRGMYKSITKQKPAQNKGDQPLSALQKIGAENLGLEDIVNYPYYHVFHGVVTQVDHSYGGGFWTGTLHCASMLHFWQVHFMSTNASLFGSRPTNSKLRMSLVGHNMTRMTPYEIIYTLFHDTVGAAHGVAFALSNKSNDNANAIGGQSFFSVVMEYWRKRFAQGTMNLRMHGVSGVLFSAAQAAFLGRLSASSVMRVLRGRFPTKETKSNTMNIQSAAESLGLFNPRYIDALSFARRTEGKKKYGSELNIASMQAFVADIGNFGQVNLFESQYQSKLDVAQEVLRVTGFELYQDVDGDIVFKPPMYNLNTASSRVYRIEDIDIFSISFQEKEPEATYATCKGTHWKNLKGLGMDNEWGVRGQYIDYRLVAQFGWKPLSFEASHFNDPRSMFFAAVNRLDIHNASMNTASLQIPLRPEIRPGYPVYITSLDCYYYVSSISHSFSFGGQCSTSLQLQAKRSKFYAPGDPKKQGIDAIDLRDQTMPKRPLEIAGDGGVPRLSGFPNVVMALDPNQINPLYFVVGSQIEKLDSPQTLKNLLKIAETNGVVSERDGNYTIKISAKNKEETYTFTLESKNLKQGKKTEIIDLRQAAKMYSARTTAGTKKRDQLDAQIGALIKDKKKLENELDRLEKKGKTSPQKERRMTAIEGKIETLVQAQAGEDKIYQDKLKKNKGVMVITALLDKVRDQFLGKNRPAYGELNSTINLLDVLSDKKAAFTNGQVPGTYTYYSASHPNIEYQGQGMEADLKGVNITKPLLTTPVTVKGFTKTPKATYANGIKAEAELVDLKVTRGLRILTSNPKKPIEVLPTSAIYTIAFTTHGIKTTRRLINYKPGTVFKSLGKSIEQTVARVLFPKSSPPATATITEVFKAQYGKLQAWRGVVGPAFPATVTVKTATVATTQKFSDLVIPGRSTTQAQKVALIADALALQWRSDADTILKREYAKVAAVAGVAQNKKASKTEQTKLNKVSQTYNRIISSVYRLIQKLDRKSRFKKGAQIQANVREVVISNRIETPVFPVSDAEGYEVVGSYRYGRNITIEPNGVFDQLLKQDPTRLLTRQQIEDLVDVLGGRKHLYKTVKKKVGGKEVIEKIPYTGSERNAKVKELVLANARANLNRDVLNANIVQVSKADATQLTVGLANWRADAQEGIGKLPINNAAYALADLHKHHRKNICSCKRAEANLLIEAFGQDKFVMVTKVPEVAENAGDVDKAVQWLGNQIALQEPAWRAQQDALRGARRDAQAASLADTFRENISRLVANTATVESAARTLGAEWESLRNQIQLGTGATKTGGNNNNNG